MGRIALVLRLFFNDYLERIEISQRSPLYQFQAYFPEPIRVDVRVLLLGLADDLSDALHLAFLDFLDDLGIGRDQFAAKALQRRFIDGLDAQGLHDLVQRLARGNHLGEHITAATGGEPSGPHGIDKLRQLLRPERKMFDRQMLLR